MDKELQTLLDGAKSLWQEIQDLRDAQQRGAKTHRIELSNELHGAIRAIARKTGYFNIHNWNALIDHVDRTFPGWRGVPNPVPSERHRAIAASLREEDDLYA